jgi:hypothetical protein
MTFSQWSTQRVAVLVATVQSGRSPTTKRVMAKHFNCNAVSCALGRKPQVDVCSPSWP